MVTECAREHEVVDAVASGRWPERCAELRAHVAACPICADVAAVAQALQEAHECGWREARVPPSGRVWWRAELRARHEAARKAAQPITIVQGLAGACAVGLVFALAELVWLRFSQSLDGVAGIESLIDAARLEITSLSAWMPQLGLPLAIGLGVWLVLTPLTLYLVFSEK
jgi:hypothetical protein